MLKSRRAHSGTCHTTNAWSPAGVAFFSFSCEDLTIRRINKNMNQNDQLTCMMADIRQIITKYTNDTTDSTVTLERDEKTGKIQVIIRIKNISEMKISFR